MNIFESIITNGQSIKESDLSYDLSEYQKWVDYDMKRYHRISKITQDKLDEAGLEVVKDDHGDYEVIAKYDESLKGSSDSYDYDKRVQDLLNIIDKSFEVHEDISINEAILDEGIRISLSAIPGVTWDREGDFTDDGNRFQAYLYKDLIPITYLRAGDKVYITIAFHHLADINYEEYRSFPSYMHSDDFNGVPVEDFNPQVFKKNLDAAYDDVTTFLSNVEEVDSQQLEDRIKIINNACREYEEKVKQYIKDNALNIMKLSNSRFNLLQRYVTAAGRGTADAIRDTTAASQRRFMLGDIEKLKEQISNSWNFKYIEEIINSVKESFDKGVYRRS